MKSKKIHRRKLLRSFGSLGLLSLIQGCGKLTEAESQGNPTGWQKYGRNPVITWMSNESTIFDPTVLREHGMYRMWLSWRKKRSIGYTESTNGINWTSLELSIAPSSANLAETEVSRPSVLNCLGSYHMWFTVRSMERTCICYARSADGHTWQRVTDAPVLIPDEKWEIRSVTCPDVVWDERLEKFRMWYSGGGASEPDAIGYCTSDDGITWSKESTNPIFKSDASNNWEGVKVAACNVHVVGDWHIMFYVGFRDEHTASIGAARSADGIHNWKRHPQNPIIPRGTSWLAFDRNAVYKPAALRAGDQWMLWYNGRWYKWEQIGLAIHQGLDLGFDRA